MKRQIAKYHWALLLGATLAAVRGDAQTIYRFTDVNDGAYPIATLAVGSNGALYGSASGVVFQLNPPTSPGGAWTENTIYDGGSWAALAVGPNGELYGTTYFGGAQNDGMVFELAPPSSQGGVWTESTLYNFSVSTGDPQNATAGVVIGKNGVLYGTVPYGGGSPNCTYFGQSYGCGSVYSLTPPASPGGAWTQQTLYTFQGGNDDGEVPLSRLAIGQNGELYGTTYYGGPSAVCVGSTVYPTSGCGTVFELVPPSSPSGTWTEIVLHSFTGARDGGFPNSIASRDGVLYGTVTFGGDPANCGGVGCGGVFKLSPPTASAGSWRGAMIYSFRGVPDGLYPAAGLVIGKDGTLYGTTRDGGDAESCPENPGCGVVFQLMPPRAPDGAWREEVLHRFTAAEGFRPNAGLVIGNDGDLYGTTFEGGSSQAGASGYGVVFKVRPSDRLR